MAPPRLIRAVATAGAALVLGSVGAQQATSASPPIRPQPQIDLFTLRFPAGMVAGVSGNRRNPTQAHAVVGAPKTDGPHPVAIVLHGNHPSCRVSSGQPGAHLSSPRAVVGHWRLVCPKSPRPGARNYYRNNVGLSYMVEELARSGFVAIAPDVQAAEQWWAGEPRSTLIYTRLLDRYLDLLADFNRGTTHGIDHASRLRGRVDITRYALVGHSRGGGFAVSASRLRHPGLFARVGIQPDSDGHLGDFDRTVPTLVVGSTCDEEVGWTDTPFALAKRMALANPSRLVFAAHLNVTGHRTLNSNSSPSFVRAAGSPCPDRGQHASPAASRAQAAVVAAEFLRSMSRDEHTFPALSVEGVGVNVTNLTTGTAVAHSTIVQPVYTPPSTIRSFHSSWRMFPRVPANFRVTSPGDF